MKSKFKSLFLILLSVFMLILTGCSSTNSTKKDPPTNEEYYTYLTDKYNQYIKSSLKPDYDIYVEDFTYNGTYDEFVTAYNNTYADLKTNLEAFKKDLETNVVKGNAEVDKINADVIAATDKAILAVDDYIGSFGDKTKDYATLTKDEVIKGLRNLGSSAHDARMDLDKMVEDAKNNLKIK